MPVVLGILGVMIVAALIRGAIVHRNHPNPRADEYAAYRGVLSDREIRRIVRRSQ